MSKITRRTALSATAATLATASPIAATALAGPSEPAASTALLSLPAGQPDPVLAAIAEHRALMIASARTGAIAGNMYPSEPGYSDALVADGAATEREDAALGRLLRCMPTTLGGVVALLEHLGLPQFHFREYGSHQFEHTILSDAHEIKQQEVLEFPTALAGTIRAMLEREGVSIPALDVAPVAAESNAGHDDPIIALIAKHEAQYETLNEEEISDDERSDRMAEADRTLYQLLMTKPMSGRGIRLLLQHLSRKEWDWDGKSADTILDGAKDAGDKCLAAAAQNFLGRLGDHLAQLVPA